MTAGIIHIIGNTLIQFIRRWKSIIVLTQYQRWRQKRLTSRNFLALKMNYFWPPYMPEFLKETCDCPGIAYPFPGVVDALGDVVEDAVFQNSRGYPSILSLWSCKNDWTDDRFSLWYLSRVSWQKNLKYAEIYFIFAQTDLHELLKVKGQIWPCQKSIDAPFKVVMHFTFIVILQACLQMFSFLAFHSDHELNKWRQE